jgi:hypothetical protein
MSSRRFRPTLDPLPSRVMPSGPSAMMRAPDPTASPVATETTTGVSYPTITCCEYQEAVDFYA